jgi:transposase
MLLTNPEDGYLIARMSHAKKNFTCPFCSTKQDKMVMNVTRRGLQCSHCGDHISFPNRFSRALFSQLPVENYTPEYNPDWLKPYFYDNYFEYNGKCFVLENDAGIGHGNKQWGPGNKPDIEGKKRDEFKDSLAKEHDVHVIRIDTQVSTCEYIKQHILDSELSQILDLSNVDWDKCDRDAQKNLVKEVCDLYMSGMKKFQDIAKTVQLGEQTVRNYLKKGQKFGWCDYIPKKGPINKERLSHGRHITITSELTGQKFKFNSINQCTSQIYNTCGIKLSHGTIRKYCNNSQSYKGFLFEFDDINNTKLI